MSKFNHLFLVSSFAGIITIFTGCRTTPDLRTARADYAVKHFEQAQQKDLEKGRILNLVDCIQLALEHNLDLKVTKLEQDVAHEQKTAEMLGMLPDLNLSINATDRNNTPASSSEKVDGDGLTYGFSQSQDKDVTYFNADLAIGILDFGLAYMNTQQADNREKLREQQTERAAQNLSLDVVRLYFQVAASQRAIKITKQLLDDCRNHYDLISEMSKKREITPFRAFDESRRFVDMEKRLANYIRSYENSCCELRSLLGFYPTNEIRVDDSILDRVPEFNLPNIRTMEQIALLQRPELYQTDIQKYNDIIEGKKNLLNLFPNVRLFANFTDSSNSYIYEQNWIEYGVRATYNLLKAPQTYQRYKANKKQVEVDEAKIYAQAIGVMTQVRIAQANLIASKERLNIDTKVFKTYNDNLQFALESKKVSGNFSAIELEHMRLATAETQIERLMSLGNYYISYYRILNTLGIKKLDQEVLNNLTQELEEAKQRVAAETASVATND